MRNQDYEDALLDHLQPSQIVCLEHAGQRLYVEIIQILRDRQAGWLRPLCFCMPADLCPEDAEDRVSLDASNGSYFLHDMRYAADLIWPLSQCRVVLDTEAIPVLASLGPEPYTSVAQKDAHSAFKAFIHNVWNDLPIKSRS